MYLANRWTCPSVDNRRMPEEIYVKDFSILRKKEEFESCIREWKKIERTEEITLPFVENMEAALLGCGIKKINKSWQVGDYCFDTLEKLENTSFDLLSCLEVQVMLEWLRNHRNEKVIVEVSGPFAVLSGLINPMKLYAEMTDHPNLLGEVLEKLTKMQTAYVREILKTGCQVISLADPAGSIEFMGAQYYKDFSGKSIKRLLDNCKEHLKESLIYICGETSYSMLRAEIAELSQYPVNPEQDYHDILFSLAKNPDVKYVGNWCIHCRHLSKPFVDVIHLKK